MLRNKFKKILLVWPIVLLLGMSLYFYYQRYQIDTILLEADGLVWKVDEKEFKVQVNQYEKGELLNITIQVVDFENKEIHKKNEVIDRDMFGGGFVRAVQVDQDPENEIVVWHSLAKYYLDFSEGNVTEVSFDQVSQQIKGLAESWHKYNVMAGMEMVILLMFLFSYYILYFVIKGILKLFD